MPILTLPNLDLEYAEYGDPHGTPVLLLHGFPDSGATWLPLVSLWRGEPVRFIAPMLRGYGASRVTNPQAASGEPVALAADADALLEALGIDRAVVVGHDWGARAAYVCAALYPERFRAVVALASEYIAHRGTGELPPPQLHSYWYQWFFHTPQGEAALKKDRLQFCRYLWEVWSPDWQFAEEDVAEAAMAWKNPQFVATVLSYYRTRYGNAPGASLYAQLAAHMSEKPKLEVPTWFLTGLADACNRSEGSLGQENWFSAGYERIELPGIGHFIQREAPEAVASALAAALRHSR